MPRREQQHLREHGGLRTAPRHHAGAAGITLLLALAALSTEEGAALGRRWLGLHLSAHALFGLDELVTGVLMYHAASWLLHLWTRPPRGRGAAAFRRELVLLHALPVALTATLYLLAPPLYAWLADPLLYLFWSVLHAVQTACARAVSAAGAEPAAA